MRIRRGNKISEKIKVWRTGAENVRMIMVYNTRWPCCFLKLTLRIFQFDDIADQVANWKGYYGKLASNAKWSNMDFAVIKIIREISYAKHLGGNILCEGHRL